MTLLNVLHLTVFHCSSSAQNKFLTVRNYWVVTSPRLLLQTCISMPMPTIDINHKIDSTCCIR